MGSSTSPLDKDMIARRLAAVRAELGLSQAALAEQVGLSKRSYIHYERGEREVPTGLVKALYDLHGIDPVWLMSGTDEAPQKARQAGIDFQLVDKVVAALDRELGKVGRKMRPEHRARVMKALYQLGVEQGRISPEIVADVVAVAVARGR
ncbi:hypothetical protein CSC76_15300 [Pseudoxanthomonas mexicana]|jgi:transcriptional regulator with XRE-family HTH domain|nr:hypothetical protein CSC76_15300 [Pseudoxanthomonas mexicana]